MAVDPETVQAVAVVFSMVLAAVVIARLVRPRDRFGERLRRRFILGLPLGTFVVMLLVLGVYLFVQGGWTRWYSPTVLPFRAWSYLYPLGMLTAGFAHNGPGHLLGNLTGTLAFAPLVEYAWGHFPRERGSRSFGSLRTNPFVRALVIFPAVVVGVGLLTSLFALGPVIGFSGVVFAFGGFALVRYPVGALVALLAARAIGLVRVAVQFPTLVESAGPEFIRPWWSTVAIQGHALGLLIGVLLGIWFVRTRASETPSALRLWGAVLLYSIAQSLWAVYWFRGDSTFVLFRAVGVVLVVGLATLVTVAAVASGRTLFRHRLRRLSWPLLAALAVASSAGLGFAARRGTRLPITTGGVELPLTLVVAGVFLAVAFTVAWFQPSIPNPVAEVPRREAAFVVLLVAGAALAGPAVPVNLTTASEEPLSGQSTAVRDYEVTYAENVTSGMVSVLNVSAFGEQTTVRTSGVIVRSGRRGIWTTAVPASRLAFAGNATVRVGGLGWHEQIRASRSGWQVAGGERAYRISFHHRQQREVVYTSQAANATPTIAGRNVSVAAGPDRFEFVVSRQNKTVGRTPVPAPNETVTAGGLRFEREERTVFVRHENTSVPLAAPEQYQ
jgi:membrane associated rhomboid family serine protease